MERPAECDRAPGFDFSSTPSTTARSGGSRERPATSRTSSMTSGSWDHLKDPTRCGWRPEARQMRLIADWLARRAGHRPSRPLRGVRRTLLERLDHHCFDAVVADAPGHPGSRLVEESTDPLRGEASSPLADGDRLNPPCRGDLAIRGARRHAKDDARAARAPGRSFVVAPTTRAPDVRRSRGQSLSSDGLVAEALSPRV